MNIMKTIGKLIVPTVLIFWTVFIIPYVEGLQCYTCSNVKHFNCDAEDDVQDCIDGTHNCCQAETAIFDRYRVYSKRCASYEACILIERNWLENGLCTGEVGSQCLKCCNETLCNGPDPTDLLNSGAKRVGQNKHTCKILTLGILYCVMQWTLFT